MDADGGDEERVGVVNAEEIDGEVAPGGIDEHARPQAVVVEGGEVGLMGLAGTCAAVDIAEILSWDGCASCGFPFGGLCGILGGS